MSDTPAITATDPSPQAPPAAPAPRTYANRARWAAATHRLYVVEAAGWNSKVLASDVARAAFDGLRALAHQPARYGSVPQPRAFNGRAPRINLAVQVRTATADEARAFLAAGRVQARPGSVLERQAQGVAA